MSSQAQFEANRANAARSTGPQTTEGKARSSGNALKHGLLSRHVVLTTEDAQTFGEHRRALWEHYSPEGPLEEMLVDCVAAQAWRLRRAIWMETSVLEDELDEALQHTENVREMDIEMAKATLGLPPTPVGGKAAGKMAAGDDAAGGDAPAGPAPRPAPRLKVATWAAGLVLKQGLLNHGVLDVLRRYERSIERGLYEALRELERLRTNGDKAAGNRERATSNREEGPGVSGLPSACGLTGARPGPETGDQVTGNTDEGQGTGDQGRGTEEKATGERAQDPAAGGFCETKPIPTGNRDEGQGTGDQGRGTEEKATGERAQDPAAEGFCETKPNSKTDQTEGTEGSEGPCRHQAPSVCA